MCLDFQYVNYQKESSTMNTFIPTKVIPGDDLHLTRLMARNSLNFVVGEDRQHLLEFGRAAFAAGQQSAEPEAQREAGQESTIQAGYASALDVLKELQGSIHSYNKNGPDWTHKDGTEVFEVSVLMDRQDAIDAAVAALEAAPPPAQVPETDPQRLSVSRDFLSDCLKHLQHIERKTVYDARDLRDYIERALQSS